MKYLFSFIAITLLCSLSFGQEKDSFENDSYEESYNVYLGLSTGINNINGAIGGNLELQAGNKISIIGGLGLGLWGGKASGGIRIYKSYPKKFYYGVSLSYYSGIEEIPIEWEDVNGTKRSYEVDFQSTSTLNLSVGYQFSLIKTGKLRLNLEGGWAIPLKSEPYEIQQSVYEPDEYIDSYMQLMSPGGLIIGIGLSLGF